MLNKPQRQEPIGLIIEILLSVIKILKAFWPIFLMLIIKGTEGKGLKFLLIGSVLFVVGCIIAFLRFKNFKFYIDEQNQEFVLQKGILTKNKVIISLDKIYEVNLEQKYLHILLGVYKVKLDTASSDKDEVVIQSLSKQNAELLRNYILSYKSEHENVTVSETENYVGEKAEESTKTTNLIAKESQINISFLALLKSSLISNYAKTIGIIVLFFNSIVDNLRGLNEAFISNYIDDEKLSNAIANSVTALIILFIILVILLNILISMFQYFGFTIIKAKNQLLVKYGLIQKHQIIVKSNRIQYFTTYTSKLMRWFDTFKLQLALIGDQDNKSQKNNIKIPALSAFNLQNIKQYLGIENVNQHFYFSLKPNFRYVIQNMLILSIIMLYFGFLGDLIFYSEFPDFNKIYVVIALSGIWLFVLILQIINLKKYNIELLSDSIKITQGVIATVTTVLPIKNIQSVKLKQAWWHQNNNLASLELNTAGGKIILPIANKELYSKMMNFILFEIESKNKSWM